MEFVIIAVVSCFASLLTFFSGFGLGTILTPAFMIFFPIEVAIGMTGVVHFLNNLFKLTLVGKNINRPTLFKFGLPAIVGGFIGAFALIYLADFGSKVPFQLGHSNLTTSNLNLVIAIVMIFFALFDLLPALKKLQFSTSILVPGGFLSGFFGGLSGHQGALRSAFLIKCGLTKDQFIATGVAVACLIDIARLAIYTKGNYLSAAIDNIALISTATLAAFIGAYFGKKLLQKVSISSIQLVVGILIIILAVGLGLGLF